MPRSLTMRPSPTPSRPDPGAHVLYVDQEGHLKALPHSGPEIDLGEAGGGAGVSVDNTVDPPAPITRLVAANAVISGDTATLAALTGVRVVRSTPQTVNVNNAADVSWEVAEYDDDVYFDIGTPTKVTIPRDGVYAADAQVQIDDDAGVDGQLVVQITWVSLFAGNNQPSSEGLYNGTQNALTLQVHDTFRMHAGDTAGLQATFIAFSGGTTWRIRLSSFLRITYLGPIPA